MARGFLARLRGLIGYRPLEPGQGLLIEPCRWIHTFLMRYPIDVIFVDQEWRVIGLTQRMAPNRIGPLVLKAALIIELPAGTIACTRTTLGDQLAIWL